MYVGPQAAFRELKKSSASQGTAAAADAASQAKWLGFGPRTPIYYDMETYRSRQRSRALRFFSAWTTKLHALAIPLGYTAARPRESPIWLVNSAAAST
jgi:hypothetical protein